jgi:hypothetical protein
MLPRDFSKIAGELGRSMPFSQQQLDEIIAEAKYDEVGLWFIIGRIRSDLKITEPDAIRAATLQCVHQLLLTGEVVAGSYRLDRTGVESWKLDPESSVRRIAAEWDVLSREPGIGDGAVLVGRNE